MNENLPKAYKQGWQDFYGRKFIVGPNVLIPRPETEFIVDAVLNLVGKAYLPGVKPNEAQIDARNLQILDVGTGSGCVAVTLKLEIPEAAVVASDISDVALEIAKDNAAKLGAKVEFMKSDLMNEITFTPDVVVANLPYVDENWEWLDKKALSHEPSLALYAGEQGLELTNKLIEQVTERGVKYLILEADPCQHSQITEFAAKKGLELVETRGFILVFTYSNSPRA